MLQTGFLSSYKVELIYSQNFHIREELHVETSEYVKAFAQQKQTTFDTAQFQSCGV